MKIAEIMSYLGEDWTGFEEVMRSSLASDVALLQSINDGMLASSGKKLRPMICLLVARALGVPNSRIWTACAMRRPANCSTTPL